MARPPQTFVQIPVTSDDAYSLNGLITKALYEVVEQTPMKLTHLVPIMQDGNTVSLIAVFEPIRDE